MNNPLKEQNKKLNIHITKILITLLSVGLLSFAQPVTATSTKGCDVYYDWCLDNDCRFVPNDRTSPERIECIDVCMRSYHCWSETGLLPNIDR